MPWLSRLSTRTVKVSSAEPTSKRSELLSPSALACSSWRRISPITSAIDGPPSAIAFTHPKRRGRGTTGHRPASPCPPRTPAHLDHPAAPSSHSRLRAECSPMGGSQRLDWNPATSAQNGGHGSSSGGRGCPQSLMPRVDDSACCQRPPLPAARSARPGKGQSKAQSGVSLCIRQERVHTAVSTPAGRLRVLSRTP